MHPYRTLDELLTSFEGRMKRLDARFTRALSLAGPEFDLQLAYCTIEAANCWAQFVRSYYLSCTVLRARCLSGNRVSLTGSRFKTYDAAIVAAARVIDPRISAAEIKVTHRQEPDWAQKGEVRKIAAALGFSNLVSVQKAFSVSTTTYSDIVTVRNFFAHRSHSAVKIIEKLSNKRIHRIVRPSEFVASLLPSRPVRVYEQWLSDFSNIAGLLCA